MSRRPPAFRQADVQRAVRAAKAAGIDIGRIEIEPDGTIVIIVKDGSEEPDNPLDTWLAKHAHASQGH